ARTQAVSVVASRISKDGMPKIRKPIRNANEICWTFPPPVNQRPWIKLYLATLFEEKSIAALLNQRRLSLLSLSSLIPKTRQWVYSLNTLNSSRTLREKLMPFRKKKE